MTPKRIIVHHSLTEDGETVSWGAIYDYHVHQLGWKDIGYHYGIELIRDRLHILKGRMDNEQGAHCQGHNRDSLGICIVGNFDAIPPMENRYKLAARLIRSLMDIYRIPISKVHGHRDFADKSCPGRLFDMYRLKFEI
jgi:N-acetylmuramoyl-L-alanine amidase